MSHGDHQDRDHDRPAQGDATTHFGFQEVPLAEKGQRVREIFDSVERHYDLMNDLMSGGLHRWWKWYTVTRARAQLGHRVLDAAGGTGDLARLFADRVGPRGRVVVVDSNLHMLQRGRHSLAERGLVGNLDWIVADCEQLPLPDNHFQVASLGFGLRNMTRPIRALRELYRVLKPGGQLLILEFSHPILPGLQSLYDAYSFCVLPELGYWVTGDRESYQYLVESIRRHPDQETLREILGDAGFHRVDYTNLTGGIVALHRCSKPKR